MEKERDVEGTLQEKRVFQFIGTGHAVPEHSLYVDTVLLGEHQSLVLHLYEVRNG